MSRKRPEERKRWGRGPRGSITVLFARAVLPARQLHRKRREEQCAGGGSTTTVRLGHVRCTTLPRRSGAPPISPSRVQALPGENKNNNKKKKKKSNQNHSTASSVVPISSAWQEKIESSYTACLDDHGYINFDHVFSEGTFGDLKLEICSGAGEWGVSQAQNDERSRYVTLELRHDRVYGTFYRSICAQTSNLCVIGGDAVDVVKRRIKSNCLSNIFINHPEPPQQNNKEGSTSQGKHLLTMAFLSLAAEKLLAGGMMTIVTDNLWYARFLMRQLGGAPHPRSLVNVEISGLGGLGELENEGGYSVYVGKPDASCGHTVDASSYFDRLWKRGNLVDRYVLVLKKKTAADPSGLRIRQYKKGAAPMTFAQMRQRQRKLSLTIKCRKVEKECTKMTILRGLSISQRGNYSPLSPPPLPLLW